MIRVTFTETTKEIQEIEITERDICVVYLCSNTNSVSLFTLVSFIYIRLYLFENL